MYTVADLAHLRFLEGRWTGTSPDGAPFYEAYDFVDAGTFRSRRYADERFSTATDGSSVVVEAGEILSRWGEYRWRAVEVTPQRACFEPVNAPSSFCWRRAGESSVEVVQRWNDEHGKEQSYTLLLNRIP